MSVKKITIVVSVFLPQSLLLAIMETPLLDLSSQEKERRAGIQQESLLFTNEDLTRLKSSHVSVGGRGADAWKKAEAKSRQVLDLAEMAERKDWVEVLRKERESLASAVNRLHVLRLRHNHLRNLYLNAPDELQRIRLENSLQKTLEELEQAEEDERKAREIWFALESEARRAGLNPGKAPAEASTIEDLFVTP